MNEHQRRIIELLRKKPPLQERPRQTIKPSKWLVYVSQESKLTTPKPKPVIRPVEVYEPAPILTEGATTFVKDRHGVARCPHCWLGFVGDWSAIKARMQAHSQIHASGTVSSYGRRVAG